MSLSSSSYHPVSLSVQEDDGHQNHGLDFTKTSTAELDNGGCNQEQEHSGELEERTIMMQPLEVELGEDEAGAASEGAEDIFLFEMIVCTFFLGASTILGMVLLCQTITGIWWPGSLVLSLHLSAMFLADFLKINFVRNMATGDQQARRKLIKMRQLAIKVWILTAYVLDVFLFLRLYPLILDGLNNFLFTEPDEVTTVLEWTLESKACQWIKATSYITGTMRAYLGTLYFLKHLTPLVSLQNRLVPFQIRRSLQNLAKIKTSLKQVLRSILFLSITFFLACLYSAALHIQRSDVLKVSGALLTTPNQPSCDPLDSSECCLPFPSMHYLQRDLSSETGWRVNLQGELLPPIKGRRGYGFGRNINHFIDPAFLNELDGFSTMGPLLFYINGMKEAHEWTSVPSPINTTSTGDTITPQLQGPAHIIKSLTPQSITFLLDVNASMLVAHSAEIDYLDQTNPLVMVFPAQPMKHNNHYALAVVNATNPRTGEKFGPTQGLLDLLREAESDNLNEKERRSRFLENVIPALIRAAPWMTETSLPPHGVDDLQLLFDFVTVSESSQLGPVRSVRDATLTYIAKNWRGNWTSRVRVNRLLDLGHECDDSMNYPWSVVARIIHAELDVPWYLTQYGQGHRGAILDLNAVQSGQPTTIGTAKFVVIIPCSVRASALNNTVTAGDHLAVNSSDIKPLRAIMEYGHGLFANRGEAFDDFLLQMAHDEGYAITAMDWRGMSLYDLPIVIKTLLSSPRTFHAIRDNLIQGYANKFALQHFTQNGMLSTGWFDFQSDQKSVSRSTRVSTYEGKQPASVFYGISQGGILGAGYTALSGVTGLIQRAVLGVPGTPFALIMTRSLDFKGYDILLLLNFHYNRHVRMFLSLAQMAWDSVEGSGLLATPVNEPYPPILLQAGLGDPVVPTIAAEALARAFNATVRSAGNATTIYGLTQQQHEQTAASSSNTTASHVTLTEIIYKQEYQSLPIDDKFVQGQNWVHFCVRRDPMLIQQVVTFINSGEVIDPCAEDGCIREMALC